MINLEKGNSYKIIIVGVGGTGSHLVSFLAQLIGNNKFYQRNHEIVLVDEDTVEEKNLRTQKFLENDIGKNKAEVLADRYESVFAAEVSYVDSFIRNTNDIIKLLAKDDYTTNVVISCVDNNKARKIMDSFFNSKEAYTFKDLIYIDTGNSSGAEELTGQTVVAYRKNDQVILPSVSAYFPQVLQEEEPEQTVSCGEIMNISIQNIGANITSACNVFNILNNIIGFHRITSDLVTFNASQIETNNMKLLVA